MHANERKQQASPPRRSRTLRHSGTAQIAPDTLQLTVT
jgi:hypothetical protein